MHITEQPNKYKKDTLIDLYNTIIEESTNNDRPLYLLTLHPGYKYAESKTWRYPSQENAIKITSSFIRTMSHYLINGSSKNKYIKGLVAVEKSGEGSWHSHFLIQQTTRDSDTFLKRLDRLDQFVNSEAYMVIKNGVPIKGSRGIGYRSEHSSFFHYKPQNDYIGSTNYQLKYNHSLIWLLDGNPNLELSSAYRQKSIKDDSIDLFYNSERNPHTLSTHEDHLDKLNETRFPGYHH